MNKHVVRSCVAGLSISAAALLFSVAVFEVGLRAYQRITQGIPFFKVQGTEEYLDGQAAAKGSSIIDSKLGWRPTPHYIFEGVERNSDGSEHPLLVTQESHGFRAFGDPMAARPRVFVIGDSYTQAVEVSDDKTYYAMLGEKLGAEVFAVAARGYGTFQESLVLDQHFEEIKPDLVIWQFCYNDFMGNYYPLEMKWLAGSIGLERPYLEGEALAYRIPKPYAWLLRLNRGVLRMVPVLATRWDRWLYRARDNNKDVLLEEILSRGEGNADFARSTKVTGRIFDRIRKRVDSIPVVMFEACTTAPVFHSAVAQLARSRGFYFVDELPATLDRARASGVIVDSYDRVHFNERGHVLVADALERYLRGSKIPLPQSDRSDVVGTGQDTRGLFPPSSGGNDG